MVVDIIVSLKDLKDLKEKKTRERDDLHICNFQEISFLKEFLPKRGITERTKMN